jgi:glucose-1-phosphate adenylyltransferase
VFSTQELYRLLQEDLEYPGSSHDFGRDIIPRALADSRVFSFPFAEGSPGASAYWRDVGTVDALWQANMELIGVSPELNLYDDDWPIWTHQRQVPPAKFVFDDDGRRGTAVDSMVAGGSIVSGAQVRRSLLSAEVRVHSHCELSDAVIFPEVDIGRHCTVRRALIDRGCRLPPNTEIGCDPEEDRARFRVTPGGVVLVTRDMLGQE